jgi:hypothetical protein
MSQRIRCASCTSMHLKGKAKLIPTLRADALPLSVLNLFLCLFRQGVIYALSYPTHTIYVKTKERDAVLQWTLCLARWDHRRSLARARGAPWPS